MRIGIDVDEVVADLHGPWLAWGNDRFGTDYKEFTHWDAPSDWWGKEAFEFLQPRIYSNSTVRPLLGVFPTLRSLRRDGHELLFVSSCPTPEAAQAKSSWCSWWFGDIPFIATSCKHEVHGLDLLVDDGFHNVASVGVEKGILVTRSHNRNLDWLGRRIAGLEELPQLLLSQADGYS